jgi:hypothetical protein
VGRQRRDLQISKGFLRAKFICISYKKGISKAEIGLQKGLCEIKKQEKSCRELRNCGNLSASSVRIQKPVVTYNSHKSSITNCAILPN